MVELAVGDGRQAEDVEDQVADVAVADRLLRLAVSDAEPAGVGVRRRVEVVEVDAGRNTRTPDQEGDPVVGELAWVGVAGADAPVVGGDDDQGVVARLGGGRDRGEHAADQVVGLADGLAVLRRHPAVGVTGDVGQRDVQERESPPGGRQVATGGVDQVGVVGPDQGVVDALGPRPVEQRELRLGREHRTAQPGRLQRREHRADLTPGGRLHGPGPQPLVVPDDAVSAASPVDPTAGHHARVVGQGEGHLDLAAGVERGRTLGDEPVEGRRVRLAEQGDRAGVEPVDRDHHHPGDLAGRPLSAERDGRGRRGSGTHQRREQRRPPAPYAGGKAWLTGYGATQAVSVISVALPCVAQGQPLALPGADRGTHRHLRLRLRRAHRRALGHRPAAARVGALRRRHRAPALRSQADRRGPRVRPRVPRPPGLPRREGPRHRLQLRQRGHAARRPGAVRRPGGRGDLPGHPARGRGQPHAATSA